MSQELFYRIPGAHETAWAPGQVVPQSVDDLPWNPEAPKHQVEKHKRLVKMLMEGVSPEATWGPDYLQVRAQALMRQGRVMPVGGQGPQADFTRVAENAISTRDYLSDEPEAHEFVELPNGKVAFCFGLSAADVEEALSWASPWLRRVHQLKDPVERGIEFERVQPIMMLCQVIASARQGPSRQAPRCFEPQDLQVLVPRVKTGTIQQLYQASERASGGVDLLREAVEAFFTVSQSYFSRLSAALSTWEGCPAGLTEETGEMRLLVEQLHSLNRPSSTSGSLAENV